MAREIAAVGNNINQLARWANTHADPGEPLRILVTLSTISGTLDDVAARHLERLQC